jgi:hypothetical protein
MRLGLSKIKQEGKRRRRRTRMREGRARDWIFFSICPSSSS